MKKIIKVVIVILALTIFSVAGFGIRSVILDNNIKALESEYSRLQAITDNLRREIDASDSRSSQDKIFLDNMFGEIFTFYDINEFRDAKVNAKSYGLPEAFIEKLYDTTELSSSAYAESMINVMCRYDSSDLYLLGRNDNVGYYVAIVNLKTVNSSFSLALFITLADSGDLNERVKSIVYYNIN